MAADSAMLTLYHLQCLKDRANSIYHHHPSQVAQARYMRAGGGGGGESAPFKCDSSFQQLISCILTVSLIFKQPVPL